MRRLLILTIPVTTILLALGCGAENSGEAKEPAAVPESALARVLNQWAEEDGDLGAMLESVGTKSLKSKTDAFALCSAFAALRNNPSRIKPDSTPSPLHRLTSFFQQIESEEAFEALKKDGLPLLRLWVDDLVEGSEVDQDDIMLILQILAHYRQRADAELVARVAQMSFNANSFRWPAILKQFDAEHPHAIVVVDALREPLPTGFIRISYLDMSNQLAVADKLARHPFNSADGWKQLHAWLNDKTTSNSSYALSATAALPFIDSAFRVRLLPIANKHPDLAVQVEAAWAQAKSGDSAGLDRLAAYCRDPRFSDVAQRYLQELGHPSRIPIEARRMDFRAMAEMASWLAHPQEFGRAPSSVALLDMRKLYWPPTKDERIVFLVKYTYDSGSSEQSVHGIGMVGSMTLALRDSNEMMSPEDIYALHCCWELQFSKDPRAPKERTIAAGRELLRQQNSGF